MTVHPLQSGNHQPVRDSGDPKRVLSNSNDAGTPGQGVCDGNLFSGLTQALHVDLNRLGKPRYNEVPFVSQTISPTARGDFGVEALPHKAEYLTRFRVCV